MARVPQDASSTRLPRLNTPMPHTRRTMNRPFKPPSFKAPSFTNSVPRPAPAGEPPAKRRRLSDDNGNDNDNDNDNEDIRPTTTPVSLLRKNVPLKKFVPPPPRQPLHPVTNPSNPSPGESGATTQTYYNVVWRKFTNKKNKTWDGDGVLSISGSNATLQDISGKELGRGVCKGPLLVGSELSIAGREIEVDTMISKEDYLAGRPFLGNVKKEPAPSLKEIDGTSRVTKKAQAKHDKLAATQKEPLAHHMSASDRGKAAFKAPVLDKSVQRQKQTAPAPVPKHSVDGENALVMKRPESVPKGKQIVDVVVDPLLTKALRTHQREGVSFLYECVMGMRGGYEGEGAILADEMGLGKTMQTIALIWTLLKQNPISGDPPVVKKALIVCPVTLINNWRKEITKWLGRERIGVYVAENPKSRITDFTKGRSYQVMIVGYEKLTKIQKDLQTADIDLVICDEGHRLKTAANKAAAAIKSLRTDRRIILSGTPIQNDLQEFWTMVDFVNPSVMNSWSTFRRVFETPILKSRQPGASVRDLEIGEARSEELAELTEKFILRRTSEILSKYLPPKTEYVLFCRPSEKQKAVYRGVVGTPAFMSGMESPGTVLELINILKKVCNAPQLLLKTGGNEEVKRPELLEGIPRSLIRTPGISGKLRVLDDLLVQIYSSTEEKVVLVSNYTATMDILATFIASLGYSHLRLDGATPPNKRQELVDRFNRSPKSNSFVFLLSAKAGGVGINLIGASRLILFDCDWNPAVDLQAMARVHRDGQKRECFIYRLLTQGTLDEKIFQRQVSKMGLADSIVDGKSAASGFTQQELRDLFTLDEGEGCQTHEMLGCECGGDGRPHSEEEISIRNDLAALSDKSSKSVKGSKSEIETINLEEDDEPFIPKNFNKLGSAADDAGLAAMQRKARECCDSAGKAKFLSLMRYTHFDTSRICGSNSGPTLARKKDSDAHLTGMNALKNAKIKTQPDRLEIATIKAEPGAVKEPDALEEYDSLEEPDALENAIEDEVLTSVIRKDGRRIGFVLTKMGHDHK